MYFWDLCPTSYVLLSIFDVTHCYLTHKIDIRAGALKLFMPEDPPECLVPEESIESNCLGVEFTLILSIMLKLAWSAGSANGDIIAIFPFYIFLLTTQTQAL